MTNEQPIPLPPLRPGFEGTNIRTWVGFKHFFYLVEEAILEWFRRREVGPQRLFHLYGLGLEIVDSKAQLPAVLETDDIVLAEVTPKGRGQLAVALYAQRPAAKVLVLRGVVQVALIRERPGPELRTLSADLQPLVAADVHSAVAPGETAAGAIDPRAFSWNWTARYFHCHYSSRVQHSAYVRAVEEVVDRFLADRGISVGRLLKERGWIPVVSRARIRMLADAFMEETIHTTFVVEEVFKQTAFDARMDCYVRRGGRVVKTATAQILHAYAASDGPDAGRVVELDNAVLKAVAGGQR